ncbi:hypothetical protein AGMMS4956_10610 [Bacteroidia bacterium]|nr:hypothetical protein AGMMS4956_10610 [Bacteroidia bacterium]
MQNYMDKKVSVVMCTYNGEKFVSEQIDSIINQTYPIHEIIIQDDCSTDNTINILRNYEKKYPNIYVFQNKVQKGINENFFSAMERATGDYIAISDQDDIWLQDKIAKQIPYVDDFLLVACGSKPFAGDACAKVYFDQRKKNIGLERIIHTNMIPGHTMVFKKSLSIYIKRITTYAYIYDKLIAMVAAAHESIMLLPDYLVNHRRLINNATYTQPLRYEKTTVNGIRYIKRTLSQYIKLRPQIRTYFAQLHLFIKTIECSTDAKTNALKISLYQSKKGLFNYIKLSLLYVKLRKRIFYTEEKNCILSVLRSLYFPISSSDYFRFWIKK